jgi:hypothetical protein
MPEVGAIIVRVIVSILILFLACCLFVIAEHEYKEWREHRKVKK